ncbi:hypothetical protein CDD80_5268 [Ophiocordyceps camponoti-rufipedis]|uniref:BTB domain-containing protein n=1 Tax=Ophiocordyceps camponoti-rufipedis TaxID=2004952 RepID=A0A2C5ZHC7_9HYPO|nr:hypothetical protein CDD80_5268 [Ophiocordyceps camponoti-rufipedis]
MERPPYEDIVISPTFRFIVGPDRREFHLHSALVSRQSAVLDNLVNGDFREAKNKEAVLEDVDEHTFVRFCEFAYTGDYSEPKPEMVESAILVTHARLYVFADCYQVDKLADVSVHRLRKTLDVLKGVTTDTEGLTELVRLCFEETAPGTLKNMVTMYASFEMSRLWAHPAFRKLVEESNELSVALIDAIVPIFLG